MIPDTRAMRRPSEELYSIDFASRPLLMTIISIAPKVKTRIDEVQHESGNQRNRKAA